MPETTLIDSPVKTAENPLLKEMQRTLEELADEKEAKAKLQKDAQEYLLAREPPPGYYFPDKPYSKAKIKKEEPLEAEEFNWRLKELNAPGYQKAGAWLARHLFRGVAWVGEKAEWGKYKKDSSTWVRYEAVQDPQDRSFPTTIELNTNQRDAWKNDRDLNIAKIASSVAAFSEEFKDAYHDQNLEVYINTKNKGHIDARAPLNDEPEGSVKGIATCIAVLEDNPEGGDPTVRIIDVPKEDCAAAKKQFTEITNSKGEKQKVTKLTQMVHARMTSSNKLLRPVELTYQELLDNAEKFRVNVVIDLTSDNVPSRDIHLRVPTAILGIQPDIQNNKLRISQDHLALDGNLGMKVANAVASEFRAHKEDKTVQAMYDIIDKAIAIKSGEAELPPPFPEPTEFITNEGDPFPLLKLHIDSILEFRDIFEAYRDTLKIWEKQGKIPPNPSILVPTTSGGEAGRVVPLVIPDGHNDYVNDVIPLIGLAKSHHSLLEDTLRALTANGVPPWLAKYMIPTMRKLRFNALVNAYGGHVLTMPANSIDSFESFEAIKDSDVHMNTVGADKGMEGFTLGINLHRLNNKSNDYASLMRKAHREGLNADDIQPFIMKYQACIGGNLGLTDKEVLKAFGRDLQKELDERAQEKWREKANPENAHVMRVRAIEKALKKMEEEGEDPERIALLKDQLEGYVESFYQHGDEKI